MRWLLLLAACSSPTTEALVTISASGLQVGVDINQLHFSATDTTSGFSGFDQMLPLCATEAPGCRTLPLSVVFYPGPMSPNDSVRVVVEGLRDTQVVLSSAAVFTFTKGVRQRLDFVLYGNCLNRLDCTGEDSICDENGMCIHLMPTVMGNFDLTTTPSEDLAAPDDLAEADAMSTCGNPGEACCNGLCVGMGVACLDNRCQKCGIATARCCPGGSLCTSGLGCDDSFHCVTCGDTGGPCCSNRLCNNTGAYCIQGICQDPSCGHAGQPCCPGDVCTRGLLCSTGSCFTASCSSLGSPCCANTYCPSGAACIGGQCIACGEYLEPACPVTPQCSSPFKADPFAGICGLCDAQGYECCGGIGGVCSGGLTCDPNGSCQ